MSPLQTLYTEITKFADFDLANDLLCDVDFDQILVPDDVQVSWLNFKLVFLNVMDYCIPKAVLPQRHNLPWLSKEIIQLIKKRDHHFKKAQHGSAADRAKFRELRNEVVAKLRSGKRSFFADLESSNVNQFWKKIRLLNRKEGGPSLTSRFNWLCMDHCHSVLTQQVEKALNCAGIQRISFQATSTRLYLLTGRAYSSHTRCCLRLVLG